jgi:cytochrome c nitrite reductase small subunit
MFASSGHPRRRLAWGATIAGALVGTSVGIGLYAFVYAKGASYLGHDSAACANCHVMNEQYDGWIKGSHRSVAECNDCHTPHDNVVEKYAVKAINGFRHSWMFTSGNFHEPIRITSMNRVVTERACRHCHSDVVASMIARDQGHGDARDDVSCIRCHGSVGHAELSPVGSRAEVTR